MKHRLMIVEDQLINMICALTAFTEMIDIEVGDVQGTVLGALKMIDEFCPMMVLKFYSKS